MNTEIKMEKMKTAKELRKEAEAVILGKVTNRESYELALKMVFETLERAKLLTDAAKAFKHQAERIGELAAAYAQEHETALDEPLHEEKDGVMSGAVTVEGVTYRLTLTRDKLRTEEDRDLVSRGAEQEAKDEQEDLRIYEPEMGGVLFWRRLGRRFGRFGPVVTPRRLVETSLWGF